MVTATEKTENQKKPFFFMYIPGEREFLMYPNAETFCTNVVHNDPEICGSVMWTEEEFWNAALIGEKEQYDQDLKLYQEEQAAGYDPELEEPTKLTLEELKGNIACISVNVPTFRHLFGDLMDSSMMTIEMGEIHYNPATIKPFWEK